MGEDNSSSSSGSILPSILGIDPTLVEGQRAVEALGGTRERVRNTTDELTGKGAGTDSDYAITDDRFEGMSAQQIYDAVHGPGGMDVAGLETVRGVWNDVSVRLGGLSVAMQARVNTLLNDGALTGSAGDAARAAATRLSQVTNQIAQVFSAVTTRTEQLYYTAEATRAAVRQPPPTMMVPADPDDPVQVILPGILNPENATRAREVERQVQAANVAAMNSIYKPGYPPAGAGVPAYAFVPDALSGDAGASGIAGTSSAGAHLGGAPVKPVAETETLRNEASAPTDDSSGDPGQPNPDGSQPNPDGGQHAEGDPATESAATEQAGTTQASAAPTQADTTPASAAQANSVPATGNSGIGTPGAGSSGSGTSGSGSGLPGAATPSAPVPGRTVPGPGGAAPLAAAAGTAGPSARTGIPGAMGPMMPGAPGQKQGESGGEHTTAEYLRRVQPDWLAGIAASASVIGADTVGDAPEPFRIDPPEQIRVAPVSAPEQYEPVSSTGTGAPGPAAESAPPPTSSSDTSSTTFTETAADAQPAPPPAAPAMSPEIAALLSEYDWGTESADATGSGDTTAETELVRSRTPTRSTRDG
ncbi:hypothetical protein ACL02S_17800 [Nocardia sp. 004]|uniref:hypothetical protein n=1 Tax=Nocardia sp. 004 TaxID=3385978 RepID=UPI00399F6726